MLSGAQRAHTIAEALVRDAVQQTLALVAKEYPLDYKELCQKYEHTVVSKVCGQIACTGGDMTCKATTKAGTRCSFQAAVEGYCTKHMADGLQAKAAERRKEAHRSDVTTEAEMDAHRKDLHEIAKKSRKVVPMDLGNDPLQVL